jgi:hypothetical protein
LSKVKDKKKKKMEKKYHKCQHDDPSTGDAQIIYGMSINGLKIDEAVVSDIMRQHGSWIHVYRGFRCHVFTRWAEFE